MYIRFLFFVRQKTAYEVRIRDWISDVCSSDLLQLAFGARIGQVRDRLTLEYRIDGRDRLDLKLTGDEAIRIDVDLHQRDPLVGIIRGDFFQHGAELLARPAPFGPEIENDETGHRRFDDVAAEGFDSLLLSGLQTERGHGTILLVQFAVASRSRERYGGKGW